MWKKIFLSWLVAMSAACLGSCVPPNEVRELRDEVGQLRKVIAEVKRTEEEHGLMMERSFRDIISHLECPNEEVRKLVAACALAKNECSASDIERVVGLMTKMHHVLSFYRPGQKAAQLLPERLGQLNTLIQGHQRTINTKILLLVLPYASLDPKANQEAETLGEDYREYIQKFAAQVRTDGAMRVIDPKVVGCERSQDLIRKYEGVKNDRPYPGEPTSKEKRTVVWTFMVDC